MGFLAAGAPFSPDPPHRRFLPDEAPEEEGEEEEPPAPARNPCAASSRGGFLIPHAWKRLLCTREPAPLAFIPEAASLWCRGGACREDQSMPLR